jgi:glycosyltransferase involved in cell wall biosynthesis
MEQNLVSILMPAYNCERFIRQAIDCILNQTYSKFELLIADDASKDNTKNIIDSYSDDRIKRFHNSQNLGYLKTSNKLLNGARGKFICFQDADDYSELNRLEILMDFLERNKQISCLGSNVCRVDENENLISKSDFPLKHEKVVESFDKHRIVMTGSALIVKREVVDVIGLYNEYFDRIGSEDIYWFSLILDSYKVENIPDHLYYYRSNPASVSSTHKNEKALVGHDLVMLMRLRRSHHKIDYVLTRQYPIVDIYVRFLLIMKKFSRNSKFINACKFVSTAILNPKVSKDFIKPFYRKMLND